MAKRNEVVAEVDGRHVALSNLDKVLYPSGFTKGEVIDYMARVADTAIPHLRGRALTLRRFPDGTDKQGFFEKRCPAHRPGGCRSRSARATAGEGSSTAASRSRRRWCGPPTWPPSNCTRRWRWPPTWTTRAPSCSTSIRARTRTSPTAARSPSRVREVLAAVELEGWCKTSGSKGLQLYVPLNTAGVTHERAAQFALAAGQLLEKQLPKRVTTTMAKAQRPGKIFVDWSQNAHHKTTIAPYSLRARPEPTVSTPVSWDEVEAGADRDVELRFEAADVLARIAEHGDVFAPVLTVEQRLPG